MDNLLDKVKRLLGGGQQPRFITDIGKSVSSFVSNPVQSMQQGIQNFAMKNPNNAVVKWGSNVQTEQVPYMNKTFSIPKITAQAPLIQNVASAAIKYAIAPQAEMVRKGIQSYAKQVAPAVYGKPTIEDYGNMAGGYGAATNPLSSIVGGGFGAIMKGGENLLNKKPITQGMDQAYREGYTFQSKLGPISEAANIALRPILSKLNPTGMQSWNTYINLAKNPNISQESKNRAWGLLRNAISRQVGEKALSGFVGMGAFGATMPAKNWEERLKNTIDQGIQGAIFEGGQRIVGQGANVIGKQVLKPLIQDVGKNRKGFFAGQNALGFNDASRKFSSLADKKLRFEVSDRQSYLKRTAIEPSKERGVVQLQDIFQHEGLWRQYPEFKKLRVSFEDLGNAKGSFNENTFTLSINKNMSPSEMRSTILHEVQHAVQAREGFARGGSPNQFKTTIDRSSIQSAFARFLESNPDAKQLWFKTKDLKGEEYLNNQDVKRLQKIFDDRGWTAFQKSYNARPITAHEQYKNLAGEIESRDVQARMNLSPEQRKYTQPYASQGIPLKDQIVRMEGNGNSNLNNKNIVRVFHGGSGTVPLNKFDITRGLEDGNTAKSFAEGPGIYFTTSKNDASMYGKNIADVGIDTSRFITDKTKISRKQIENIIKQSPELETALSNWHQDYDTNPNIALKEMVDNILKYNKTPKDIVQAIWAEAYHGSHSEFMDAMAKNGFDGLVIPKDKGLTHYVLYNRDAVNKPDVMLSASVPLTPEQQAASKKLPGIMYSTSKTKAEGIPSVTPKSDLLKKASDLERIGKEIQYQNSLEKDAINQQIAQLTSDDLKNLSSLRKMVNSRAGQEGDIETLYSKNKYLVNKVLDRMREITRDYELNTNRSDEDLLNIALSLPSKSKARIPKPTELKLASELRKQAQKVNDLVYNAEPKLKIQTPEQKAAQDYKEWSDLLFRQTVKNEKQSTDKLVNSIGDTIESNTQKLLQQKYAIHSKSGNILVDKAGNPLDADIMRMAESWKDKPRLSYSRETIDRNFEDIMGKDAPEMIARYIEPVKAQEANRIRWLNNERKQISSLGIKARSQDSALVQKLGEGKIDYQDLYMEVKGDKSRADKIIKAVDFFKSKYKQYLKDINSVLEKNGYDPIPERKDYFTHFQEVTNVLEQIGIPQRDTSLPTDVNGLTADFKPGKNFFSSALPRLTDVTDFDAIQGIDRYIDGASKQIFHTNNIQSLRLLEKSIRHKFAGTTKLTNFVADLTEYTNNLAGKKSMIDRAAESLVGRTIYAGANRLKRQVGANMVGANVASALTNYIPLTQSLATTNKRSFVKGMMQTIGSIFKNDGFVERSDFLTRRLGSDRLSINLWDKIGEKAGWLFKAVDNFTSQVIVRSKFDEGIAKGLSPARAMQYADDWAARIMADRSLGSMPTLFNSQTLGLLTQFQLEVNNQLSFMAKDIPRSFNKVGAASALGQVFLYSYLFNNLFENIVGRRPAFDPIGIIQQSTEDYNNPNISSQQATKNTIGRISDSLPFTSVFTGGRLPIGAAIPDPFSVASGKSTIGKEAKKLTYLLPPLGGGQAQKTFSGIQAFNRGQSETDSGAVRYPIEQNTANRLRTTFFGQYSTPEARKYFREGEKPLGDQQSSVLKQSQDKKSIYQQFIDKRNADNKITQTSEQMKQDGSTSRQVGNTILLLQSDGKINKIDLNFQPKEPKLTGNTELDKKLISKYKGEVTRKANDILALYEAGKMTADEAEKAISELKTLSTKFSTSKVKKPKKISLRIKKAPRVRTIKIKMAKLPKIKKAKRPKVLVSSPKLRLKIT